MATKLNLDIRQGETFQRVIRWERLPFIYKPITAIANDAPVEITAVGHGLAVGWRTALINVEGMIEINARHDPPRSSDFHQVTVVDADNITLNDISAADFSPYTSGGYLKFYTPVDLSGYQAKMEIKDRIGGTILETLSTGLDARIALDNNNHTISLNIAATDTAAFSWLRGVYDLEMTSPSAVVTTIYTGSVRVIREVTT